MGLSTRAGDPTDMNVIGHRGCPVYGPENTVRAVENAIPHVDMFEIDVRRCGSGELVVFHDETTGRVTDADLHVSETSLDRLRELGVDGTDEPIPTLQELFDAVPSAVGVNVELKEASVASDVAGIVADVDNEVLASSFYPEAIRGVAAADPSIPLAHLFKAGWPDQLDRAADLGCEYVHPRHTLLDADRVAEANDRGFGINAWTIEEPERAATLREWGVDGVVVDDWRVAEVR